MEDAELEWEIQKHPYSEGGKVRWILNTGKKAVITGVALTSVPFVLPPLVVISALGFAFSVPFGLVCASYACTRKVMTKLLPPPTPPPLPGFEEDEYDGTAIELEEQMEDLKRGVEMRIELDQLDDPYEKGAAITVNVVDEANGYEEEDVVPMVEAEEVLEENDESLAEIRPAVVLDNGEEENVIEFVEAGAVGESINNESDIGMEKKTTVTESEEEIVEEANNAVVMEPELVVEAFTDETMVLNKLEELLDQDERNILMVSVRENGQAAKLDENMEREAGGEKSEAVSEEQRNRESRNNETDENAKSVGYGDITKDNLAGSLDEDTLLKRKKENVILSNADVRETADECGIYLFEDRNACFKSLEVNGVVKEKKAVENVDFLEFHSSIQAPDQNVKSVPEVDTRAPSTELYSGEEKIWEQINAIRAIVGYRATPQPTCIAELKALYIFTGVELPALFKADSDLHEVNDKLRFLMSIVGVK